MLCVHTIYLQSYFTISASLFYRKYTYIFGRKTQNNLYLVTNTTIWKPVLSTPVFWVSPTSTQRLVMTQTEAVFRQWVTFLGEIPPFFFCSCDLNQFESALNIMWPRPHGKHRSRRHTWPCPPSFQKLLLLGCRHVTFVAFQWRKCRIKMTCPFRVKSHC